MLPNCKTVAKPACFLRVCFQVINACRNHGRNHALRIFGNKTGVKNILDVFEISAFPCNLITQKSVKKSLRSWAASPRAGQGVGEAPSPSPSRGAAQGQHPRCGASGRGTAAPSRPALRLQPPQSQTPPCPCGGFPASTRGKQGSPITQGGDLGNGKHLWQGQRAELAVPGAGSAPRRCSVPAAAHLSVCPSICTAPKRDRGRLSTALRCSAVLAQERCPLDGHEKLYTITLKQTPR